MRFAFQLFAALLIISFPGAGFAAIYKWVNANGVITFRDTPPPEGVKAQIVDATPSFSGGEPASTPATAPTNRSQAAMSSPKAAKVELYSTSWCPYCKNAANFFRANNIPFIEYDIEKDPNAARRKDQLDSKRGVPFAIINGQKIHGFAPSAYKGALGLK